MFLTYDPPDKTPGDRSASFRNSALVPARETGREDRLHCRYPITLDVEYRLIEKGRVVLRGFGKIRNISSGGVLFDAHEVLPASAYVEVLMNWPVSLNGSCRLKLVMRGRIARVEGKTVAVWARSHEFRTSGAIRSE